MIANRTFKLMACVAVGLLGLCSCSAHECKKCDGQAAQKTSSIQEIDSLYTLATSNHHQPFRKPAQDEQARNLRLLSEKADLLVAETAAWDSAARLTSLTEAGRESVRREVSDFRTGLAGIKSAAQARNLASLREQYAVTKASYAKLVETVDLKN